jgi:hypothetical protein
MGLGVQGLGERHTTTARAALQRHHAAAAHCAPSHHSMAGARTTHRQHAASSTMDSAWIVYGLLGAVLVGALHAQQPDYAVTLVERSALPTISAANARGHGHCPARATDQAPCQCFNPAYIPASAHKLNQSGVLLRICCGKSCDYLCMRRDFYKSIPLSACTANESDKGFPRDDEYIGFAPCDITTGKCGDVLPRSTFSLDPSQGPIQDPRAFGYNGTYYSWYWTSDDGAEPCDPSLPQNLCSVGLSRSDSPLTQGSWKIVRREPWARNACCLMKPRGEKSYCIWGMDNPDKQPPKFIPGLGISWTTDIDNGNFTQAAWKVAPGVFSPLGVNSTAFLMMGPGHNELGLEAGARPVPLSDGNWLHFYASHTCGFGWNPSHYNADCRGAAGNYTGNYTVGWVILNGSDPTHILARHNHTTPWMNPVYGYETLCNNDHSGRCKWCAPQHPSPRLA